MADWRFVDSGCLAVNHVITKFRFLEEVAMKYLIGCMLFFWGLMATGQAICAPTLLLFSNVKVEEVSIRNGTVGFRVSDVSAPVRPYSCLSTQNSGYVRLVNGGLSSSLVAVMSAYSLQAPVNIYTKDSIACDGAGAVDFVYPNTATYPNSENYPGQGIEVKAVKLLR